MFILFRNIRQQVYRQKKKLGTRSDTSENRQSSKTRVFEFFDTSAMPSKMSSYGQNEGASNVNTSVLEQVDTSTITSTVSSGCNVSDIDTSALAKVGTSASSVKMFSDVKNDNISNSSKVNDHFSAVRSNKYERTSACKARKFLPKEPKMHCRVLMRMFLHSLSNPDTKHEMLTESLSNKKFQGFVAKVTNVMTDEIKIVNQNMRKLYALRSKGIKKTRVLLTKCRQLKKGYSMRRLSSLTGMTYRAVYRVFNPPKQYGGQRKVSETDIAPIYKLVFSNMHSMTIPYRRFSKYFYLRDSMKEIYGAYVRQQMRLIKEGNSPEVRVLSKSAWYKHLPREVRSQKYIPFMECLCVKCLNLSNTIDALHAAGVVVEGKRVLLILRTICPFLMDKSEFRDESTFSEFPESNKNAASQKKNLVKFANVEEAEYSSNSVLVTPVGMHTIAKQPDLAFEKKHDTSKFLVGCDNAPMDIGIGQVVANCNPKCMLRTCDSCGILNLKAIINKDNPTLHMNYAKHVVWFKWCSDTQEENGKVINRPFNRYKFHGLLHDLLNNFYAFIQSMSTHLFHFKWQSLQYEYLRETIVHGEVGMVMDFGQNINHKKQFEAQSSHFNRRQSTIFPIVCFFRCKNCVALVTHEICCISDDLKHDAFSVRAFELEAVAILKESDVDVTKIYEWTDNCGLEFKSKYPLFLMSIMNIAICRNTWGENHGKGPADAVIGRVSQIIRSAIARGIVSISHGVDMVLFLQKRLETVLPEDGKCVHYRRSFVFVDSINRNDMPSSLKTLKGTRALHCFENTNTPGLLKVRRSSCMCRCLVYSYLFYSLKP